MKKLIKISMIFAAVCALMMASCSGDDNDGGDPIPDATCTDGKQNGDETGVDCGGTSCNPCPPLESTDLNGSLAEDRTLDSSKEYSLTGTFSVESGATLTIPAGTKIVSQAGTDKYIVVQKGGLIDIQWWIC